VARLRAQAVRPMKVDDWALAIARLSRPERRVV
jgi:hypothetical protein